MYVDRVDWPGVLSPEPVVLARAVSAIALIYVNRVTVNIAKLKVAKTKSYRRSDNSKLARNFYKFLFKLRAYMVVSFVNKCFSVIK